jgi:hypothetical protein
MLEAATGAFGAESVSVQAAILECMFEDMPRPGSDPEVIARFDELFERRHPSKTPESAALLDRICAARAENRAAAAQLDAIGQLFGYRLARCSENEDWAIDTMGAVAAEVAAALRISQWLAASRLRYAHALRERLPKVADIFHAGDIDYRMFQTLVYRTDLITDPDVLAAVDAQLAVNVVRWPSMTQGRLAGQVDKIVEKQLPDGTLILTSPSGHTYVTTPGSALLFPSLCLSTGGIPAPDADPPPNSCGQRTAMMPKRRRTRAQNRAHRIATERRQNHDARTAQRAESARYAGPAQPHTDEEPPPF